MAGGRGVDYKYDVFISYSHEDKSWVLGDLVPKLEEAGLRAYLDRDFPAGRSARKNMAEAVKNSRRTLLVLTSAWLNSEWSSFESQLAGLLDPAGSEGRLIPLRLEKVEMPEGFRHLTYRDYTAPGPEAWEALLRDLAPSPEIEEERDRPEGPPGLVKAGLDALVELMQVEAVRTAVTAFEIDFENARRQIGVIGEYKRLHERLQVVEFPFRILDQARSRLPQDQCAWQDLEEVVPEVEKNLRDLLDVMARASIAGQEVRWPEILQKVLTDLEQAVGTTNHKLLSASCRHLRHVLAKQLAHFDDLVAEGAKALQFAKLLKALATIQENLPAAGLDPDTVESFCTGIEELKEVDRQFQDLVSFHNTWQQFDDQLRYMETVLSEQDDIETLVFDWPDLAQAIAQSCKDSSNKWDVALREAIGKVDTAISVKHPVARVKGIFRGFRSKAQHRFNLVDRDLLELCSSLETFDEPLARIRG